MSRAYDRQRKRLDRLESMAQHGASVRAALDQIWKDGSKPQGIYVRPQFIATRDPRIARSLLRVGAEPRPLAPAVRFLTPHGIALQTYLVSLFEARCRLLPSANHTNRRPLRPDNQNPIGWINLVTSYAQASTHAAIERVTVTDNRIRQLKNALRSLADANLVKLNPENKSDRFEFFQILDESGRQGHDGEIAYKVPSRIEQEFIFLPRDFFLQGWVHVLSPGEIATYLMLRHLSRIFPDAHEGSGVFITGMDREISYGLSRDTYENHLPLAGYGLISRTANPDRRSSGKIANFHEKINRGFMAEAHRFRINNDRAFSRSAFRVVSGRLRGRAG